MQKTIDTAVVIFIFATAVVLIGGIAVIPTTMMQSASANHGEPHGSGGGGIDPGETGC